MADQIQILRETSENLTRVGSDLKDVFAVTHHARLFAALHINIALICPRWA